VNLGWDDRWTIGLDRVMDSVVLESRGGNRVRAGRGGMKWRLPANTSVLEASMGATSECTAMGNAGINWDWVAAKVPGCSGG